MAEAAFATLAGAPILEGTLSLPREGAWFARLRVGSLTKPSGLVPLVLGDLTLQGTVLEGGVPYGRLDALVVGGAGRLGAEIAPYDWEGVPLRIPLEDALRTAGETLAADADAAILGRFLATWTRTRGPLSNALVTLCRVAGATWRVGPSGGVWVGVDAGAPSAAKGVRLDARPAERARVYGLDAFQVFPGETFDGRRVGDVQHTLTTSTTRTVIWTP